MRKRVSQLEAIVPSSTAIYFPLVVGFVSSKDAWDPMTAQVQYGNEGDERIDRQPGETVAAFETRARACAIDIGAKLVLVNE